MSFSWIIATTGDGELTAGKLLQVLACKKARTAQK